MRYRLRTLLILLAVLPPALAGAWFALPVIDSLLPVAVFVLTFAAFFAMYVSQ